MRCALPSQGRKGNWFSHIFAKRSSYYFTLLIPALKHLWVFSHWSYLAKSVHICNQSCDDSNHTSSSLVAFEWSSCQFRLELSLEVTVHSEPTASKCAAAYVSSKTSYLGISQLAYNLILYCFQMFTVALLDPSGILHHPPKLCRTQIICVTSKFYYQAIHPSRLWTIHRALSPARVFEAFCY